MKISETEILIVPGYKNAGPDHWQTRWEKKLSTARRVQQEAWSKPVREDWIETLAADVNRAERPVVLVAHSLGIPTSVLAIPKFKKRVAGAFFVALPEVDNPSLRPKHMMTFGPYPREPLPFPSIVIASRNDPFGRFEPARDTAKAWGSDFYDIGEAGHINDAAGFGPWPEGTLMFGRFVSSLR